MGSRSGKRLTTQEKKFPPRKSRRVRRQKQIRQRRPKGPTIPYYASTEYRVLIDHIVGFVSGRRQKTETLGKHSAGIDRWLSVIVLKGSAYILDATALTITPEALVRLNVQVVSNERYSGPRRRVIFNETCRTELSNPNLIGSLEAHLEAAFETYHRHEYPNGLDA